VDQLSKAAQAQRASQREVAWVVGLAQQQQAPRQQEVDNLRPGRQRTREETVRMGMGLQLQLKQHLAMNASGT
jgi:hypothetical protein